MVLHLIQWIWLQVLVWLSAGIGKCLWYRGVVADAAAGTAPFSAQQFHAPVAVYWPQ
jgi:hypothetical protein